MGGISYFITCGVIEALYCIVAQALMYCSLVTSITELSCDVFQFTPFRNSNLVYIKKVKILRNVLLNLTHDVSPWSFCLP